MKAIQCMILVAGLTTIIPMVAQPNLDSLYSIWQDGSQPDSSRVQAFHDYMWNGFLFSDPDTGIVLANELTVWSKQAEYALGVAQGLNNKGVAFTVKGNFSDALENYVQCLKIYEGLGDQEGVGTTTINIGAIYMYLDDLENSMEYFQRSLQIMEALSDKQGIANSLGNIGMIHDYLGNFNEALEYYDRSLMVLKELDDKHGIAHTYNNIGVLFDQQKDYPKALENHTQSLRIREELNDQPGIVTSLYNIGTANGDQGDHETAMRFCQRSYELALSIGSMLGQRDACDCLYNANKSLDNYTQALDLLELREELDDSLNATETAKKLQRMEFDKELLADSLRQEEEKHSMELAHQEEVAEKDKTRNLLMGGGLLLLLVASGLFSRNRYVNRSRKAIQKEKDRSEELLLNILPEEVAEELKDKGEAEAQLIDQVTVLFTDFKGFTALSEKLSPKELVDDLNLCFSEFDRITAKYGIEKIKTIGDAYMAAGGLPTPNTTHATDVIKAALEMRDFVEAGKSRKIEAGLPYFEIRIGVHTGPVVAGIVGVKKFQYDIWGDTVNTASRMESSGEVGLVNISAATYELVKENSEFDFTPRGKIEAKGKGAMEMHFVDIK